MSSTAPATVDRRGVGVLLLTFGSAVTAADVPAYLRSVRGGREPGDALVAEFRHRFELIGRSPLIDITMEQAAALERLLAAEGDGHPVVAAGMLHSRPTVVEALGQLLSRGAERVVAVVLAPQYSRLILSGYERSLAAAVDELAPGLPVHPAGAWHLLPAWIASLAERVREALDGTDGAASPAVIFTAHSLPRPVLERDPQYMTQIDETIRAVADAAGLTPDGWIFAFQSAGHTPEEWLKPDLADVLGQLSGAGATDVLVVPVQFVADHLETLYDIDIAAADQARAAGLRFRRIAMPNGSPRFIAALAEVVDRELAATRR